MDLRVSRLPGFGCAYETRGLAPRDDISVGQVDAETFQETDLLLARVAFVPRLFAQEQRQQRRVLAHEVGVDGGDSVLLVTRKSTRQGPLVESETEPTIRLDLPTR